MLSQLFVLSLASARPEYNFRVVHAPISYANSQHSVHKRSLTANATTNTTANSTIQPIVNASLTSSYNFYVGSIYLGTPEEQVDVLLDTGSPVSWVYGPEGSYDNASMYYANESSTSELLNTSFSAAYGSGEYLGHWVTDLASAPQFVNGVGRNSSVYNTSTSKLNTSVPFEFGVISSFATSAGAPGLLGLGPHIDSAGPSTYQTLSEAYASYNITSSPAFSVFLEENAGRFLFGSVDQQYFDYPFHSYTPKDALSPSVSGNSASATSWRINLTGVYLDNGTEYKINTNVVLDTGSPVSLLPANFVDAVGSSLGLTKYDAYETYYLNSTKNATLPTGVITFNFNGFEIEADLADFLVPGEYIWVDDGPSNVTALALMGSNNYLLGDAFFRNAYTVFDPSTAGVMIAQRTKLTLNASNQTNGSSIIPITNILHNSTAIVNGTLGQNTTNTTSTRSWHPVATSTAYGNGVTTTVIVVAANQYQGTVPAGKAASLTASSTGKTTSPTYAASSSTSSKASSKTTGSATSASASSSSSSSSTGNGGLVVSPGSTFWGSLLALILVFIN